VSQTASGPLGQVWTGTLGIAPAVG